MAEVLLYTLLAAFLTENVAMMLLGFGVPTLQALALACALFTITLMMYIWTGFGDDPIVEKLRRRTNDTKTAGNGRGDTSKHTYDPAPVPNPLPLTDVVGVDVATGSKGGVTVMYFSTNANEDASLNVPVCAGACRCLTVPDGA